MKRERLMGASRSPAAPATTSPELCDPGLSIRSSRSPSPQDLACAFIVSLSSDPLPPGEPCFSSGTRPPKPASLRVTGSIVPPITQTGAPGGAASFLPDATCKRSEFNRGSLLQSRRPLSHPTTSHLDTAPPPTPNPGSAPPLLWLGGGLSSPNPW